MVPPDIISHLEHARKTFRFRIFDPQNWLSVSERQRSSALDPEAKGPIWVSRVTLPSPVDDHVRQALFETIDKLSTGIEAYSKPMSVSVEGEWVGHRRKVDAHTPEPAVTEEEKYNGLMKDISNEATMLYVHGGAFYSGSPAQSRPLLSKLTALTRGRCFSLQYRLSPQHAFPAALLDLFHAYLNLLYPQKGPFTFYSAVPARNIVLTGDSVGANLCLGFIQVILSLARQQSRPTPFVRWNGTDVPLHLPQGLALLSPWVDQTYSLPSCKTNQKSDYLPAFSITSADGFPQCSVWPSDPPREDVYCDASSLVHPLVCPLAAEDWRGAPPTLVICGEEGPSDAVKILMQQFHKQGVVVRWREFQGLPHVFMLMMNALEHSRVAVAEWAEFCKETVRDSRMLGSSGEMLQVKDLKRTPVDLGLLTNLTREEGLVLMRRGRESRVVIQRADKAKAKI